MRSASRARARAHAHAHEAHAHDAHAHEAHAHDAYARAARALRAAHDARAAHAARAARALHDPPAPRAGAVARLGAALAPGLLLVAPIVALLFVVALVALIAPGCARPVGSEGGPCTGGGGCDVGLVCLSSLCVDGEGAGEGEGEGEGEGGEGEGEGGCQGDDAAQNDRGDCASIPAAACGPLEDNTAVQTCDVAGAILRSGLFQAAFDCLRDIPAGACASLAGDVDACFGALTACPLPAADALCAQADEACVGGGDDGFPIDQCTGDLRSTNQPFREAYAACFNGSGTTACNLVHDDCYNTALNAVVGGG